jgi:HPt (histidine-containing phosphotransfer) domain-containing protein
MRNSAVTMPPEPVLDPESIAALNAVSPDDGGAFLRELIDIFLADTPVRIGEVISSLERADAPTLTRAAHSIKGAAGNFGARQLAAVALEVETAAKRADFAGARARLGALESEFAQVKSAMEALRAR